MSPRSLGLVLVTAGFTCFSTGGLLTRLAAVDGWTNTFWRSLFMMIVIAGVLGWRAGGPRGLASKLRGVGRLGLLSGFFLSLCFVGFLMSLERTLVARAVVIMSTGPLFAALFAWAILRERPAPRTFLAMGVACAGMVLMVLDGLSSGGSIAGDLFALMVAVAFAANIVVLRKAGGVDMLPSALVAGALSIALCGPFADLAPPAPAMSWLAVMGVVQLAGGLLLFLAGARYLMASETAMLSLLESVLAVLWVAIFLGEVPSTATMIGGAVVIAGVAINAAGTGSPRTAPRAAPA